MTPIYLNSPPSPFTFMEIKDQQQHDKLQPFLSPQQQAHHQYHTVVFTEPDEEYSKPIDYKVYNNFMAHDGSSDQQASSSCSVQSMVANVNGGHNLSFRRKLDDGNNSESTSENNGSSVKWMSSKVRVMKKNITANCHGAKGEADDDVNKPAKFTNKYRSPVQDSDHANSCSETTITIRVCSDCNTTTTPLWRSGPRGPKSLCNACGIRQRKARRAMEAAAAANGGEAVTTDASSMKIKIPMNKEKKSRTNHMGQYKKQSAHFQNQKRICSFKEFALSLSKNSGLQSVFPQDVEDAAILLMELSCGLVHS